MRISDGAAVPSLPRCGPTFIADLDEATDNPRVAIAALGWTENAAVLVLTLAPTMKTWSRARSRPKGIRVTRRGSTLLRGEASRPRRDRPP